MKKTLGICLISLVFMGAGCASKTVDHSCHCGKKEATSTESCHKHCDDASHKHHEHSHKDCDKADCDLKKKSKK